MSISCTNLNNFYIISFVLRREFLRLGDPLSCVSLNDVETVIKSRPAHRIPGGPVPLTRIKTLVSMTTPRDFSPTGYEISHVKKLY